MTEEGVKSEVASKTGSKRAVKMVPVIVIGRRGTNKIVQYKNADGYPNRVYVPSAEEKNGNQAAGIDVAFPSNGYQGQYVKDIAADAVRQDILAPLPA